MFNVRAKWEFEVGTDEHGDVFTAWSVWSDESEAGEDLPTTESDSGMVMGPLHEAIFAAYDAMGVTCPFVLDNDLLRWGGHKPDGG